MKIHDLSKFKGATPQHAEGFCTIQLKDPITGKVTHEDKGKNTIFKDNLFIADTSSWVDKINKVYTVLSASSVAANQMIPYIREPIIGYGVPNLGTLGTYRGAYNSANQVLSNCTLEKMRWLFQYDFTTPQANGTINSVGLTSQYAWESDRTHNSNYKFQSIGDLNYCLSSKNYKVYNIVNATGVVTIFNNLDGTSSTVDLSATVGTSTSEYKRVGVNMSNDKMYIYKYSSTAANRRLYEFSDNTFTTLVQTYNTSAGAILAVGTRDYFFAVKGDYIYAFDDNDTINKYDFINDELKTPIDGTSTAVPQNIVLQDKGATNRSNLFYGVCIIDDFHLLVGASAGTSEYAAFVFDTSTDTFIAQWASAGPSNSYQVLGHPIISTGFVPSSLYINPASPYPRILPTAITQYNLAEPITKTSANAMTVTYELEVYW